MESKRGSFICIFISYIKMMESKNITFVLLAIILLSSSFAGAAAISFDLGTQVNLSNNSGNSQTPQFLASGTNVYAVWKDNTSGSNNILFKKSSDSGATFGSTITLDTGSANSQDPQVSVSGSNVYSVWQEGTGPKTIEFAKSTDGGSSFGAQVVLSSSTAVSTLPQIASDSSNVYVAWLQGGTDVYFSDSGDSGSTFDSPIQLSTSSSKPRLATSGNNVYVAWEEGTDISFVRSTDTGETFDAEKNLSSSATSSTLPEIIASGTNVFVTWKEGTNIYFAKSTDSGSTFSAPIDIGDTGGSTTPNPKIAYDGTTIYVVWSQTVSGKGDISFTSSSDGGSTFGTVQNLSNNSGSSITPQVSAAGGNISVVWRDDTPGNNDILMKSSDDSGATFGASQNISSNSGVSQEPRVSVVGTRVFAVWEDTTPDGGGSNKDILFVTGTPSTVSISFDKSEYTLNESAEITVDDSAASGTIDVTVSSTSDATGLVKTLTETGSGTGIFKGNISFGTTTSGSTLQAKAGDTITVDYSSQSTAATIFPITIEVQVSGSPFTSFGYGNIVNVQVEDKNSNQDSLTAEVIDVTITSTRDAKGTTLSLTETGPNTGIFGGSSSTLIFTDGDAKARSTGKITISQIDATKNTNSSGIDTSTVSVKSTSDTTGISLILEETGLNTGQFKKPVLLTTGSSVSNEKIKVQPGDIVSVTSGFFTSNALVIPVTDNAKGAISVKFDADDTVTVSYLAKSH